MGRDIVSNRGAGTVCQQVKVAGVHWDIVLCSKHFPYMLIVSVLLYAI